MTLNPAQSIQSANINALPGGGQLDAEMMNKISQKEKELGVDLDQNGSVGSVTNGQAGLKAYMKHLETVAQNAKTQTAAQGAAPAKKKKKKGGLGGLLKSVLPKVASLAGNALGGPVGGKIAGALGKIFG